MLVTGSADKTWKTWDLSAGQCTRTVTCGGTCYAIAVDRAGLAMVTGHNDGVVRFFDLRTGRREKDLVDAHTANVTSVAYRSDHDIITMSRDNTLQLIDLRRHEAVLRLSHPSFRVGSNWTRAALSPSCQRVAAGGTDGSMYLWDISGSGGISNVIQGRDSSAVSSCAWSNTGLASCNRKGTRLVMGHT